MQTSKLSPIMEESPRHWRFISLMFMVFLYPKLYAAWTRPSPHDSRGNQPPYTQQNRPYLPYISPPPLRFDLAKPPPDLLMRPPAAGPPDVNQAETPAQTPGSSYAPMEQSPALQSQEMPSSELPVDAETPSDIVAIPQARRKDDPPPPIIPDDTPVPTKHEDFLPFFRYPDPSSKTNVILPVPPQSDNNIGQPPSSATYQQR